VAAVSAALCSRGGRLGRSLQPRRPCRPLRV